MRLIAYHGFLQNKEVMISGRLVYGKLRKPKSDDSVFQNIVDMVKTYFAIGVPKRTVSVKYNSEIKSVKTSKSGSFMALFRYRKGSENSYQVSYKDKKRMNKVFLPNENKDDENLAIISDIDDTFLVTHSVSFFKRIWVSASRNFNTRNPVKDLIGIYRNFSGSIFYVSNSQWRLYDVLDGFRKINNLPLGPFLLRGESKHIRIRSIIKSYPYDFVLIGDDSQLDPEEYHTVEKEFPDRIKAICIRHISSSKRYEQVKAMLPESKSMISSDGKELMGFVKGKIEDTKRKRKRRKVKKTPKKKTTYKRKTA